MKRHLRLLGDAAKTVDARSARSKQRKVGASEIGVCRRRAGYSHHGHPITDVENVTGLKAVAGSWYHKGALDTMRREWGSLIETTVENTILRGHVDAIELPDDWREIAGLPPVADAPDTIVVDDLKTKDDARAVDYVRMRGPNRQELYQTHLYGGMLRKGWIGPSTGRWKNTEKALAEAVKLMGQGGLPVETVRLRYMARTGHENAEYIHEQRFDEGIEEEAWDWVEQVTASKSPDDLPRDQDGPGLSIVCDNCPFLTACWGPVEGVAPQSQLIVTDLDLVESMREYDIARVEEAEAKRRKAVARAKLDATDAAIYTDGKDVAFKLSWSGGRPVPESEEPDVDQMIQILEKAQVPVPMKVVPAKTTAKSIGVVPWEAPDPACGKPVGEPVLFAEPSDSKGDLFWLQDRARGGWTARDLDEQMVEELTVGQFAKRFPGYVDPRPPCVLKPKHSGDCVDDSVFVELDLEEPDFAEEIGDLPA